MATIFEANHNGGPPVSNYWPSGGSAALSVTGASGLNGTAFGLQNDITVSAWSVFDATISAPASDEIRLRWRFDVTPLTFPGTNPGTAANHIYQLDMGGGGDTLINMRVRWNASNDTLFYAEKKWTSDGDAVIIVLIDNITVSNTEHCVDMRMVRETADGNNDGIVQIFIDGVSVFSQTNFQNFNAFGNFTQIVHRGNSGTGTFTGNSYSDEFLLTDDGSTSLCPAVATAGELTIAPMRKPADVDADSTFLYIASISSLAFPVLIKIATSLDADGSLVFDPGAGDDIGVQCGREDTQVVWVAGAFDGTNTVEKSEDSGDSFTVKDDSSFGDVEAFVVGPDSDNRVLIADDNVNIEETIDSGAVWINRNTTTGFNINAIARLDINPQETVFGNDANATDNIDSSVNSGVNMEDFTTGDFPTDADVTSVIVN